MSVYLQIDADVGPIQIASNVGYGEFGDWVDSLDLKTYGNLIHLYEYGWCQDMRDLIGELGAAIKNDPPKSQDVADVAKTLAEYLEGEEDAIVATITDGVGNGGDKDDNEKSFRQKDNPDQPRDEHGQFASEGGGAAATASQLTGRAMSILELPVKAEHAIDHAVKAGAKHATDWLSSKTGIGAIQGAAASGGIVASIGHGVSVVGKVGAKASFAGWTAGQSAVEAVAKAKGLSDADASKVRSICSCYDAIACKGVFLGLEHADLPHLAAVSGFIPTASCAYLAYSAATNPIAVCKAAKGAISKVAGKFRSSKSMAEGAEKSVGILADAIKAHAGDDWYFALLSEAMEASDDAVQAVKMADAAYAESESPKE